MKKTEQALVSYLQENKNKLNNDGVGYIMEFPCQEEFSYTEFGVKFDILYVGLYEEKNIQFYAIEIDVDGSDTTNGKFISFNDLSSAMIDNIFEYIKYN